MGVGVSRTGRAPRPAKREGQDFLAGGEGGWRRRNLSCAQAQCSEPSFSHTAQCSEPCSGREREGTDPIKKECWRGERGQR